MVAADMVSAGDEMATLSPNALSLAFVRKFGPISDRNCSNDGMFIVSPPFMWIIAHNNDMKQE